MNSLHSIRRKTTIYSPPHHKFKRMTKRNTFRRRLEASHLSVQQISHNPRSIRLTPQKSGPRISNMLWKPTHQLFLHMSILHRFKIKSRHHISNINKISIFHRNNKDYNNKCKSKNKLYLSKAPIFSCTSATKEQINCPKWSKTSTHKIMIWICLRNNAEMLLTKSSKIMRKPIRCSKKSKHFLVKLWIAFKD